MILRISHDDCRAFTCKQMAMLTHVLVQMATHEEDCSAQWEKLNSGVGTGEGAGGWLASFPGHFLRGRPGIICSRMREIPRN